MKKLLKIVHTPYDVKVNGMAGNCIGGNGGCQGCGGGGTGCSSGCTGGGGCSR